MAAVAHTMVPVVSSVLVHSSAETKSSLPTVDVAGVARPPKALKRALRRAYAVQPGSAAVAQVAESAPHYWRTAYGA
jgi:hypothetical protein